MAKRKPNAAQLPIADEDVLDLDELFGVSKPIRVKLDGQLFDLLPLNALGPEQMLQMTQLQREMAKLTAESVQNDPVTIGRVVDRIITIICPELSAQNLSFPKKLSVLDFYNRHTSTPGKKTVTPKTKNQTGGARSHA